MQAQFHTHCRVHTHLRTSFSYLEIVMRHRNIPDACLVKRKKKNFNKGAEHTALETCKNVYAPSAERKQFSKAWQNLLLHPTCTVQKAAMGQKGNKNRVEKVVTCFPAHRCDCFSRGAVPIRSRPHDRRCYWVSPAVLLSTQCFKKNKIII